MRNKQIYLTLSINKLLPCPYASRIQTGKAEINTEISIWSTLRIVENVVRLILPSALGFPIPCQDEFYSQQYSEAYFKFASHPTMLFARDLVRSQSNPTHNSIRRLNPTRETCVIISHRNL